MTDRVTLELPELVMQRAREAAQRTGRPLEGVLVDWLERVAASDGTGDDERPVEVGVYPIFTPYGNEAAAQVLLDVLNGTEAAGTESK